MGFFGKKKEEGYAEESLKKENEDEPRKGELLTALEKLEFQVKEQKAERDQLLERVKIVKDEYDATISNLMMVKKELNQKKLELDVAQREHKSILEKIKGLDRIKDDAKQTEFVKTEAELEKIKKELEEMTKEHEKVKEEMTKGQSDLHLIRKQQIDVEKELEEANSRLYNAKEELEKKDQFQDTSVLTPKERKFIEGETGKDVSSGVIEAASAVVGSLKSKLSTTQKELDTVQNLLEKEREAHAETRKELEKLKSES
ncbi:DNA repair protein [Nitrosopumilus sp.]|uniref:DNA repair protein n=1 Tax=Nitrosopumilus sp. TaxID=2024843 RepID=UPI00261E25FC|nr:DNA repair protein [Nitrosopumilus sp.]